MGKNGLKFQIYHNGFLTKYQGSLNNLSGANGDFRKEIFARDRDGNNPGETEKVVKFNFP